MYLQDTSQFEYKLICPFCVEHRTKFFSRSGDLRYHVKTKHPIELRVAPHDLFSNKVAFYFSTEPALFIKSHEVENPNSATASYAKYLVTKWAAGRSPGISTWIKGWELACESSAQSRKRKSSGTATFIRLDEFGAVD